MAYQRTQARRLSMINIPPQSGFDLPTGAGLITPKNSFPPLECGSRVGTNRLVESQLRQLSDNWKLTPATMAHKLNPLWICSPHLAYISTRIASGIAKGGARIIISVPPRHGKPLPLDTLILKNDGTYQALGTINVGDEVITGKGRARKVLQVFEQGKLPIVMIHTQCGRFIRAALDHPFLTMRGWVKAEDLQVGDNLAVRHSAEVVPTEVMSNEEARILGYFIGDGCCVYTKNRINKIALMSRLICQDPKELKDIYYCVETLGWQIRHVNDGRYDLRGGVREWLRDIGIAGMNSHTKRVPEKLFKCSNTAIANFIGAYFACDGTVSGTKRRSTVNPIIISCNLALLRDVQSLLLRLGIRSQLTSRWHKGGYNKDKGGSIEHRLEVNRRDDVERFAKVIPIPGIKAQRLQDKMQEFYGQKRPQPKLFAEGFFDDKVMEITHVEATECRCLEVAEDHTFLAYDVVVHNSELITKYTTVWCLEHFQHWNTILATYGAELSTDFGRQVRDIIQANKDLLSVRIRKDVTRTGNWKTDAGGGMASVGVGGAITGRGANVLLIDDYIKEIKEAMSKTVRDYIWDWFRTTAYTRIEPGGSCIIIATRWDDDDLIGHILKSNLGSKWDYIELPALALPPQDAEGKLISVPEGWTDIIGRHVGEPLFTERYSKEALLEIKEELGSYFFNCLYQQRPETDDGKLTDPAWLEIVDILPPLQDMPQGRIWDLAATADGGDYTAGGLMTYNKNTDTTYILNMVRKQMSSQSVESKVRQVALADGLDTTIYIEQEPGASGKALVTHYENNVLPEFTVVAVTAGDGKLTRAQPFLAAAENGKVKLLKGSWNAKFIEEFKHFPKGDHDDQIDTVAIGYQKLVGKKSFSVTWGRHLHQGAQLVNSIGQVLKKKKSAGIIFGRRN